MKYLNWGLVACLVLTQYAIWLGDKNVFDWRQLQKANQKMQQQNEQLSQRNDRLLAEVVDIKAGGETIETLARSELGLVKPGETFYQIVE